MDRFTALLDANVIYPAGLRDVLLRLADRNLYRARWSAIIHDEWIRNVLKDRSDLRAGFKSYSNVTIPCETPRHEPDACYERPRG